jgi:hypothetical protein
MKRGYGLLGGHADGHTEIGTPNPAKAKELMADVTGRAMMLDLLLSPASRSKLVLMGLGDVDFGEALRAKAAVVTEAALGLNRLL